LPEEDDCADEREEYERLKAERIAAYEALNEVFDRFTEIPGHGDYTDEGYTGPGADLAEQIRRMKQEAQELGQREREAYARLVACEGGGSGEDDCADERLEYELLKDQRLTAWQAINEAFDRFVAIPDHGDYNDESYAGPGADLAEQIRRMKQEAQELGQRERAAYARLLACEGGGSGEDEQDSCDMGEVERMQEQVAAFSQALQELAARITATPGVGRDWQEDDYTGPAADLAEQYRGIARESNELQARINEALERQRECEAAVG
jgi:hypothetical protein